MSTNGCFDLLHLGHIRYLGEARNLGDILIVGVNADSSVRKLKGDTRPIHSENTRMEQLAALECVDYVTLFSEQTPEAFLQELKPNIHVKGGDYKESDLPEAKVVRAAGGEIRIVGLVGGYSTTGLIEKLQGSK